MFRHLPKTILSNIEQRVMFHYNIKGLCYCGYKGSKHWFKIQSAFYLRQSLPSNITQVKVRFFKSHISFYLNEQCKHH